MEVDWMLKLFSTPLISQIPALKVLMAFADQLWLYNYDDKEYDGPIKDVFITIELIETLKWAFLNFQKNWQL